MMINRLEVIRGNATFLCECIECGYKMESTEHCIGLRCPRCGGQMRRAERPGPGQPKPIQAAAGQKIELTYGDSLRVTTSFKYRSSSDITVTIYGAIGNRRLGVFDEIIPSESEPIKLLKASEFTPATGTVDIPITGDISPGEGYDILCKIKEFPDVSDEVDDVITITGLKPTFELLEETIYPYAYIYEGPCEVSTFTFKSDPFTPASWISGLLAKHVEKKVREAGGQVLEMRVYVDKSPLLWTDWQIEVVGISPSGISAQIGIAWWAVAILAALAIALIIVLTWSIKTIVSTFKRNPALEDVKVGWDKETLIQTIQDSEKYWKRPQTPKETLEGMSEEELREYLDKIAEEEVPTGGIPWGWIAVGAGALGVILLASQAKGKEKKK